MEDPKIKKILEIIERLYYESANTRDSYIEGYRDALDCLRGEIYGDDSLTPREEDANDEELGEATMECLIPGFVPGQIIEIPGNADTAGEFAIMVPSDNPPGFKMVRKEKANE